MPGYFIIAAIIIPTVAFFIIFVFFIIRAQRESAKKPRISAEKAQRIIDILDEWFWAIENGTANRRRPDPDGQRYDADYVDNFIRTVDEFFKDELRRNARYWRGEVIKKPDLKSGKPIDIPPEFNRLEGAAREAFVQEVKLMTKWLDIESE